MYVTDDNLEGKVVNIKGDKVTLLCTDDFEYDFYLHQVFKKGADNKVEHQRAKKTIGSTLTDLSTYAKVTYTPRIAEVKHGQIFDLHIEELAPNLSFENAHETLQFQLSYARNVMYTASQKRIRRVIFVQGLGGGEPGGA